MTPFEVNMSRIGDRRVIQLRGDLHFATAPELEVCLEQALLDAASAIVLKLGGVKFIDSTGLRILLRARDRCASSGRDFLLVEPLPDAVKRLFRVAGVSGVLPVHDGRSRTGLDLPGGSPTHGARLGSKSPP